MLCPVSEENDNKFPIWKRLPRDKLSFAEIKAYTDSLSEPAVPVKGRNKSLRERKLQGQLWCALAALQTACGTRNVQCEPIPLSMVLAIPHIYIIYVLYLYICIQGLFQQHMNKASKHVCDFVWLLQLVFDRGWVLYWIVLFVFFCF